MLMNVVLVASDVDVVVWVLACPECVHSAASVAGTQKLSGVTFHGCQTVFAQGANSLRGVGVGMVGWACRGRKFNKVVLVNELLGREEEGAPTQEEPLFPGNSSPCPGG